MKREYLDLLTHIQDAVHLEVKGVIRVTHLQAKWHQ